MALRDPQVRTAAARRGRGSKSGRSLARPAGARRDELIQSDAERLGDAPQDQDGRVALPALGLPEVGHREPGCVGEILQRHVAGGTPLADVGAEGSKALAIDRGECLRHPGNLAPRRLHGQ